MKAFFYSILVVLGVRFDCFCQSNPAPSMEVPPREIPDYKMIPGVQHNNKTKLYGVLDSNLNISVPFIYENLFFKSSDFIIARKDRKVGVISIVNKIIHDFKYDYIDYVEPYMIATIRNNDSQTSILIDTKSGKEVISIKKGYDHIKIETNPENKEIYFKAFSYKEKTVDIYNSKAIKTNSFKYDDVVLWGEYWISFLNDKQGVITKDGKELIKPEYKVISWVEDGFVCAYNGKQATIIDLNKNKIYSSEYFLINKVKGNGYFIVIKKNEGVDLHGIINSEFQEVLPLCNCQIYFDSSTKYFVVIDKSSNETKNLTIEDLKK